MYESQSNGLRLSSVHIRNSKNRWLASILSYSSRNRRRVGCISERGTNLRQSEQTHLENTRHFRLMKEKQHNNSVWGSTKLSDTATGGNAMVSDIASDFMRDVVSAGEADVEDEIELTVGTDLFAGNEADCRRNCLL